MSFAEDYSRFLSVLTMDIADRSLWLWLSSSILHSDAVK